ncbi:translation initiation factor IF-2, partial [bacterium]|nr:translation initiation factor IF-2 [bacterium]
VISIMGHVDHGKTTLLDSIRASKHKIVNTEVGGITQSIGAYTIYLNDRKVVFLDTPGHEAFTEMRARGAKATDIAILVVAADDGIMPQTIEAINHAKAAEIPIIVAVNKIDKAGADPDRILTQLTEHGLVPEAWGGDTITCNVSALQRQGIDELLEYILLVADMQDLKANPNTMATGVVIEANLDKGKGPVATLLVQNGTLKVGNCVIVGTACGRVRALLSDSGEKIKDAEPSTPVEILGLTEVPQAGDAFEVVANEKEMKAIIEKRKETERTKRLDEMLPAHIRKEAVSGEDNIPQLNLIIKANTHGASEDFSQAIAQMESDEIATKIIHVGVGDISEADVMLASASKALSLGFSVKEDSNALAAAEREHVIIKKYDIIYQILEDMEKTMLSLLEPEIKEVALGKAEIRQVFTIGKTTKIAGCYVLEGKILRNKTAVLVRNGQEIFRGAIDQLKRFKDDVKEVAQGFECGISFAKFNDLQEGDIIEVSTTEEVERKSL